MNKACESQAVTSTNGIDTKLECVEAVLCRRILNQDCTNWVAFFDGTSFHKFLHLQIQNKDFFFAELSSETFLTQNNSAMIRKTGQQIYICSPLHTLSN
jgi:hypothetical protein